jgi:hypothetical protein
VCCARFKTDIDALDQLVKEFMAGIDSKIAHKADVEQLNDKMGRLETDDLLNQITNQLTEKLRRASKEMQASHSSSCFLAACSHLLDGRECNEADAADDCICHLKRSGNG